MVSAICGVAGKAGVGLIQVVGRQVQAVLLLQVLLPLKLLLFLHRQRASSSSQSQNAYVNSETPVDSNSAFLHCGDVSALQHVTHAHAMLYEAVCTSCAVYAGPLHVMTPGCLTQSMCMQCCMKLVQDCLQSVLLALYVLVIPESLSANRL